MNAREKGAAACRDGRAITENPYRQYYSRRHPWSGWQHECYNPAHYDWHRGFCAEATPRLKEVIRDVLAEHGQMFELEFGLAVMAKYARPLTAYMVENVVREMKVRDELVEDGGMYRLANNTVEGIECTVHTAERN